MVEPKPEFDHQVPVLKVTDEIKGHPDYNKATGKNETFLNLTKHIVATQLDSQNIQLTAEQARDFTHFVGRSVGKTENSAIKDAILAAAKSVGKDNSLIQKLSSKASKGTK